MNKLWLPALVFFLSACSFTPKPYISDEYQKYKVSDLKVPERPHALKLETEFTRKTLTCCKAGAYSSSQSSAE